jgi:hypothetical protein
MEVARPQRPCQGLVTSPEVTISNRGCECKRLWLLKNSISTKIGPKSVSENVSKNREDRL